MRIVLQGSCTPSQMGKAVQEILENTLEKAEVKGKKYPIHNAVIEFNLNIAGEDKPMLLMDEERGAMLTIHTGIEKGKFVDYVEPDRKELLDKFYEMVDNATKEEEGEKED
ncbi:hypothetical protein PDQ75_25050 [Bacillus cereus group sp. Bc015]|uniref:hypothetical protein n=1 Tax=Bacillus cereus group sp. Bc015 TaxID=3018123 RepID=UPI0022E79497|nr:hypothetical protein [Bacillus cereus group sp. Bc015]MDA2738425.1 hypothetical protein [Bacillus cereus group sp. Bc015]